MAQQSTAEIEGQARYWADRLDYLQEGDGAPEYITASYERDLSEAHHNAMWYADELERRAAYKALEAPEIKALALASLTSPPAGPDELGSPMVWIDGREFWADEVLALRVAAA
jgi:hypothetical protein